VFVAVALLLLLGTPLFVSRRVRRLRNDTIDVADQARLLVSEFETAFATELIASPASESDHSTGAEVAQAVAIERKDESELNSVAARLGREAVARLVQLRTAEERWRGSAAHARSASAHEDWVAGGREVLAAAASLRDYLYSVSSENRARVRQLERVDVAFAMALTPIALVALAIVVGFEQQTRALASEADDRASKLAHSVELRSALIHGVVHDIKNPLGAASGYAELLQDGLAGPLNEQQQEMVRRMNRLVGTAQGTVTELVDLARVDADEFPIDRREANVTAVVREIVDDHRATATRKGIELTFDAPNGPIVAMTDAIRVRHVVENLVSNAIKYTPEHGTVRVATTAASPDMGPRVVRVTVQDSGPGVPPEFRERIFDAFFRVPSSEERAPGSGLGLAMSRRIARLLGGDVTVDAAPTGGSIFTFTLPVDTGIG
jgi:signal transduction histidine kinase